MDEYEKMLGQGFENIKPCEECERFEVLKVEGHHEGSRTVISNFCAIASCLRRDSEHLAKFLFKELATSGYVPGDRLILDRKLSSKSVNEKIEKYVNKFVLCPKCKKPDTELVCENGHDFIRCLACGAKKPV